MFRGRPFSLCVLLLAASPAAASSAPAAARASVQVEGVGLARPDQIAANPAQARAMALRAALAAAQQELARRVRADRSLWPRGAKQAPDRVAPAEIVSETYVAATGIATVVLRYDPARARGGAASKSGKPATP